MEALPPRPRSPPGRSGCSRGGFEALKLSAIAARRPASPRRASGTTSATRTASSPPGHLARARRQSRSDRGDGRRAGGRSHGCTRSSTASRVSPPTASRSSRSSRSCRQALRDHRAARAGRRPLRRLSRDRARAWMPMMPRRTPELRPFAMLMIVIVDGLGHRARSRPGERRCARGDGAVERLAQPFLAGLALRRRRGLFVWRRSPRREILGGMDAAIIWTRPTPSTIRASTRRVPTASRRSSAPTADRSVGPRLTVCLAARGHRRRHAARAHPRTSRWSRRAARAAAACSSPIPTFIAQLRDRPLVGRWGLRARERRGRTASCRFASIRPPGHHATPDTGDGLSASSTTSRSPPPRPAAPATSASPSSTGTSTTATARRRPSYRAASRLFGSVAPVAALSRAAASSPSAARGGEGFTVNVPLPAVRGRRRLREPSSRSSCSTRCAAVRAAGSPRSRPARTTTSATRLGAWRSPRPGSRRWRSLA